MRDWDADLRQLQADGLYRRLRNMAPHAGPTVSIDGRDMLMLASNDYLGLRTHPRIVRRMQDAAARWGAGAGAARLISGNTCLFGQLEERLAAFKKTEAALVFSTGYMANLGLLQAVAGPDDVIFSDALNHASIVDGCRLSRARTVVYPHADMERLEAELAQSTASPSRVIVTDGLFSMDGDCAPVARLRDLAHRYDALLVVDDAHGTATLGPSGAGVLEWAGMDGPHEVIVVGTLGKALGSFGAFVAGPAALKPFLVNRARSFMFTTALPPPVVAAALEALQIVAEEPGLVVQLQENAQFMRQGLTQLGFDILHSTSHIIPLFVGDVRCATEMAAALMNEGLFLLAIRPPSVPPGGARLRLTVMATHTREDLSRALESIHAIGRQCGLV